jgi:16S rRNA (guanine527-N7)-methyltransferase
MVVSRETEHLPALGERYGLTGQQMAQLSQILTELASDPYAPTTARDWDTALQVHLADALVALKLPGIHSARTIADLGAGAGFPGLALAVALPRCEVAAVESQARKCAFIERVAAAANVQNARVVCVRAEEWPEGIGTNDIVTARALAAQPVVLEYAAPLLRAGGTLVDWRGRRNETEEREAAAAAGELGLRRVEIRWVEPYAGAREHHLHVYEKVSDTPSRYPRRPGMASKRPLGRTGASHRPASGGEGR